MYTLSNKIKLKSIKPYTNVFRTYFIKQRMSYKYHMPVYINASSIRKQEKVDNLIQHVIFTCNFSKTPKNIHYICCCLTYFMDEHLTCNFLYLEKISELVNYPINPFKYQDILLLIIKKMNILKH